MAYWDLASLPSIGSQERRGILSGASDPDASVDYPCGAVPVRADEAVTPAVEDPDEIEITPEMIEAGVAELAGYNSDFESMENAAERIFMAMASVAPQRESERLNVYVDVGAEATGRGEASPAGGNSKSRGQA